MTATYYPVITICGSMRYYQVMLDHALEMTRRGFIVLMPFDTTYQDSSCSDKVKEMLDDMHLTKISMSEEIHVIGSHIGESTKREIQYATEHDIIISYYATP